MNNILKSIRIATVGLLLAGSSSIASAESGACCTPWGCWVTESPILCEMKGGTYQGDGTTCDPDPCGGDSVGACCTPFGCWVTDPILCEMKGGTYQGDDTTCDPDPCGDTSHGACCLPDGSCIDGLLEYECINNDGVMWVPNRLCSEINCSDPTGACCFGDTCTDDMPMEECDAAGGYWEPDNSCAAVCAGPVATGACCYYAGGGVWNCVDNVTWDHCKTLGNPGCYWSPSHTCDTLPCPPPGNSGACCFGDTCTDDMPMEECDAAGGYWVVDGICSNDVCDDYPSDCPADFNGDGQVDITDLLAFLDGWGTADADIDGDGDGDIEDLLVLISAWGAC